MTKLTATFSQYALNNGPLESDLNIEVDYNPEDNTVECILRVWAYNYRARATTDLSAIFSEQFPDQLEEMITKVDWREVYMEKKIKVA